MSAPVIAVTDWEEGVGSPSDVAVGYVTASGSVRGEVSVVDRGSVPEDVRVDHRLDVVYDTTDPTVVRLAEDLPLTSSVPPARGGGRCPQGDSCWRPSSWPLPEPVSRAAPG